MRVLSFFPSVSLAESDRVQICFTHPYLQSDRLSGVETCRVFTDLYPAAGRVSEVLRALMAVSVHVNEREAHIPSRRCREIHVKTVAVIGEFLRQHDFFLRSGVERDEAVAADSVSDKLRRYTHPVVYTREVQ